MFKNEKSAHSLALLTTDKLVALDHEKGIEVAALETYQVYSEAYKHPLFILESKEAQEDAKNYNE